MDFFDQSSHLFNGLSRNVNGIRTHVGDQTFRLSIADLDAFIKLLAMDMVLEVLNPSLLKASCCKVLVINGAGALRLTCLVLMAEILKADLFISATVSMVNPSDLRSNFSHQFSPN